jgi:hypothetical protein
LQNLVEDELLFRFEFGDRSFGVEGSMLGAQRFSAAHLLVQSGEGQQGLQRILGRGPFVGIGSRARRSVRCLRPARHAYR